MSTSRLQIRYRKESTPGEGGNGQDLKAARVTSFGLQSTRTYDRSGEIEANRNVTDRVLTDIGAEGDIGIQWSFGTQDDWLEVALWNTFSTALNASATNINAVDGGSGNDSFEDAGAAGAFTNAVVGQFVLVAGFTNAANNGFHRVIAKPDNDTIEVATGSLVAEVPGTTVTVKGSLLTNGILDQSLFFERQTNNLATKGFFGYRGYRVNTLSASIAVRGFYEGTMGLLGLTADAPTDATTGSGTVVAAPTTRIFNAITGFPLFQEGGATPLKLTNFGYQLSNNIIQEGAIQVLGADAVEPGDFEVEGSISSYLRIDDLRDLHAKIENDTATELQVVSQDGAGNAYLIDFPQILLTNWRDPANGPNQSHIVEIPWQAAQGPYGWTMGINRFPAA